ncbi:DoxX family protein [Nonomuraea dietziae]|uniref:DoxX family protein n=1 Tax=Nonomuraea dietziae TaxID=65515 RepID=UPI0033F72B4E
MTARVWPRRLSTILYWYLAVSFFIGFATKFWPGPTFFGPAYSEKFVDWGWPPWMRFVVGTLELVFGLMMIVPRRRVRFIGAAGLVFVLIGAVTTHLIDVAPLYEEVSAPLHLTIMIGVALANWPSDWRDLLHPLDDRSARAAPSPSVGRATTVR